MKLLLAKFTWEVGTGEIAFGKIYLVRLVLGKLLLGKHLTHGRKQDGHNDIRRFKFIQSHFSVDFPYSESYMADYISLLPLLYKLNLPLYLVPGP